MEIIEYGSSWLIKDQLNAELFNEIKYFLDDHLDFLYEDTLGYSSKGDNIKQYWIEKLGKNPYNYLNSKFEDIEKKYRKEVYARLKKASLLNKHNGDNVNLSHKGIWIVKGEEGSYHTSHIHADGRADGVISVLYLDVPQSLNDNNNNLDNSIFLIMHTNPSNTYITHSVPNIQHIKPEVGTLLLFPFYIPHGTYPQTKGNRQTFNIDYVFEYNPTSSQKIDIRYD